MPNYLGLKPVDIISHFQSISKSIGSTLNFIHYLVSSVVIPVSSSIISLLSYCNKGVNDCFHSPFSIKVYIPHRIQINCISGKKSFHAFPSLRIKSQGLSMAFPWGFTWHSSLLLSLWPHGSYSSLTTHFQTYQPPYWPSNMWCVLAQGLCTATASPLFGTCSCEISIAC